MRGLGRRIRRDSTRARLAGVVCEVTLERSTSGRRQFREDRQNVTTWRVHIDDSRKNNVRRLCSHIRCFLYVVRSRGGAYYISRSRFDKSTVRDDNMIGGFEEVVTLYRLRHNYPFRDDASGFACRSVFATLQGARNFGHASKNALRNNPREPGLNAITIRKQPVKYRTACRATLLLSRSCIYSFKRSAQLYPLDITYIHHYQLLIVIDNSKQNLYT